MREATVISIPVLTDIVVVTALKSLKPDSEEMKPSPFKIMGASKFGITTNCAKIEKKPIARDRNQNAKNKMVLRT